MWYKKADFKIMDRLVDMYYVKNPEENFLGVELELNIGIKYRNVF